MLPSLLPSWPNSLTEYNTRLFELSVNAVGEAISDRETDSARAGLGVEKARVNSLSRSIRAGPKKDQGREDAVEAFGMRKAAVSADPSAKKCHLLIVRPPGTA